MMSFRESKNFLWYTTDELGRGSFGTVYRGVGKVYGEPVAVKVPNSNVLIAEEIEQREIDVCQRINHRNIVKLLGYEEEKNGSRRDRPRRVIIMELCDGGSLLKILENPMNHFGLEEDEFLIVLRDITAGMKYLRENDIVHRDLKPANIMRCIADDGSSIYKITDFGAARELAENQEYSSIFGTEEYLHPDVYEQALLPETAIPNKKFSPSTDLWSIGATLYHVATGFLPFRPKDGRKNRKVMHAMTTKKESGVISAYQEPETGRIIFEKQLPKNCLLSPDLRKLLCPLLAGLMEVDPRKKLTYESYFERVDEILKTKQLHIFYINKLRLLRFYINPNVTKTFVDLKNLIQINTKTKSEPGVLPEDQILLFKDSLLQTVLEIDRGCTSICSKLPQTSKMDPIILCNRSDTEVTMDKDKLSLKSKQFPNVVDYRKDAEIAIRNCAIAHHIKRQVQEACLKVNLIYSAVQTINQVVVTQLTAASKENILIRKAVHSMKNQFEMMKNFHSLCVAFAKLVPEDIDNSNNNGSTFHDCVKELDDIYVSKYMEFQSLDRSLLQLKPSIDALLGSRVHDRVLMSSWEQASAQVKGVNDFQRIERISSTHVTTISQCNGEISGDMPSHPQKRRNLEPDEECLHLIERSKMIQTMEKLKKLLDECISNYESLTIIIGEWYKQALTAFIQPEILANDIKRLQKRIAEAEDQLTIAVQDFRSHLAKVTDSLSVFPVVTGSVHNCQNRKESVKAVRQGLRELSQSQQKVQSDIKVQSELVSKLCDQLHGLTMAVEDSL